MASSKLRPSAISSSILGSPVSIIPELVYLDWGITYPFLLFVGVYAKGVPGLRPRSTGQMFT